jgi:hypothetical protein
MADEDVRRGQSRRHIVGAADERERAGDAKSGGPRRERIALVLADELEPCVGEAPEDGDRRIHQHVVSLELPEVRDNGHLAKRCLRCAGGIRHEVEAVRNDRNLSPRHTFELELVRRRARIRRDLRGTCIRKTLQRDDHLFDAFYAAPANPHRHAGDCGAGSAKMFEQIRWPGQRRSGGDGTNWQTATRGE